MPLLKAKEKKERALGTKLFLKGIRCNSPKCAMVRRPYRPGIHGKKYRSALSEFGQQLLEKQKIKISYGLKESQIEKIFDKAAKAGNIGQNVVSILERRLDNVIFKIGFAASRICARQYVNHGHFLVNNKKVTVPSYQVKINDIISIKPASKDLLIFRDLSNSIKKYNPPDWLTLDKEKIEGKVKSLPHDIETPFDVNIVVDYYSR
ncbi:MAG: 30S ribosomal protein S4 [Patescibacteria group bacterium]